MTKTVLKAVAIVATLLPAVGFAQSRPTSATYITDEEVKKVNALPGVDRTIKVVDIGPENFAIGVIHRGASAPASGGGAAARGAGAGGGVRRTVDGASGQQYARHDRARPADRRLSDHLGRRHARHWRQNRQRPEVGAGRRSDQGAERPVLQRAGRRR